MIAGTWLKISIEAPEDRNIWIRKVFAAFGFLLGLDSVEKTAAFKRQADLCTLDGSEILHHLGCIKPCK